MPTDSPTPLRPPRRTAAVIVLTLVLVALIIAVVGVLRFSVRRDSLLDAASAATRPAIQITPGKVRAPLQYRVVSFHRGKADKHLIALAHDLGFNGVQIQIEGSTVDGIKDFAKRDAQEGIVDYCHSLGMKVTLWVHEMSDLPDPWMPNTIGPITVDNAALWTLLDNRYEWMLHDAIPNVDGLALTVVETQVRATDTAVMLKLTDLLREKTHKYGKSLWVRTFVWYPDEFNAVMSAVRQFPPDQVVMCKCVPQDWQMRGINAPEITQVGNHPLIVEYDVAGEYFLRNEVANCMPDLLKKQFDYQMAHGVCGICVRVDREDSSVLNQPQEVNLWALGMLASGASDNLDEIWNAWATNRFGPAAASGVIRALKPSGEVISEMLSIGPFTDSDTRYFPPLADEDVFGNVEQNWWWDKSLIPTVNAAEVGEEAFTAEVAAAKTKAMEQANLCLTNLELVKEKLTPQDYAILKNRLETNKAQLAFRSPMILATLHYRRLQNAESSADRTAADAALQKDLADLRQVAQITYGPPQTLSYLGQTWTVGPPSDIHPEWIYQWIYQMDMLRRDIDPRTLKLGTRRWYGHGYKADE